MDIKSASAKPPRRMPWSLLGNVDHTIGVIWPCYGSGHIIYGLGSGRYRHRTLATATLQRLDTSSTFFRQLPLIFDISVPLVHTFNALPVNKDFVVSFELELPRFLGRPTAAQMQQGMRLLASSRCKALLAMSDFAHRFVRKRLIAAGFDAVVEKMSVFRGAVADPMAGAGATAAPAARDSYRSQPFSAIVVGSQLFRKGGMQAILAFEKLRAEGYDVRLTLIGDFETECYAIRESLPSADVWRARAASHDWVRFLGPLPNAQVMTELQRHDLCLYPSLDESLGWLTIEAGMLGVPVLGNRICAFPELIEDRQSGWLVDLPVDDDGRWRGITAAGAAHGAAFGGASEAIIDAICACVRHAHAHPTALRGWGARAQASMRARYGMARAAADLDRIYDRALARA